MAGRAGTEGTCLPFRCWACLEREPLTRAVVTRITLEQGGPAAFGTKYLYFLTKAHRESDIAPVLDSVVRAWFAEQVRRGGL